jgi:hypothetical protein
VRLSAPGASARGMATQECDSNLVHSKIVVPGSNSAITSAQRPQPWLFDLLGTQIFHAYPNYQLKLSTIPAGGPAVVLFGWWSFRYHDIASIPYTCTGNSAESWFDVGGQFHSLRDTLTWLQHQARSVIAPATPCAARAARAAHARAAPPASKARGTVPPAPPTCPAVRAGRRKSSMVASAGETDRDLAWT